MDKRDNFEKYFGIHLTIDGYGGNREFLQDRDYIYNYLEDFPEKLNMHKIHETILVEVSNKSLKDPGGLSGFVLIAESHISIHTFPMRNFLSADVYTCLNYIDVEKIQNDFRTTFVLSDIDVNIIKRGKKYFETF